jgi:signal transduction histidine kinase
MVPLESAAAASEDAEAESLRCQLVEAQQEISYWKWALTGVTALYIFIYIMGRRRLMRKIWKRNKQLRSALAQADEANRMKAAFIRSVSHEIRTPLNAINGFSQLLCSRDYEFGEEEKEDMRKRISESTETITSIINELLQLAQGESQSVARLQDIRPNEICRAVVNASQLLNNKKLELWFESNVSDEYTLRSNHELVSQILTKMMDNAMKFTDHGKVQMICTKKGKHLEISVTDTGIGVPKAKRAAIFENFVKLDDYKVGIGLGLPICRRLARTLGGDIILDAEYTNGSRFILQLPC